MKKRIVIKIGSSSLISNNSINYGQIEQLAKSIIELKNEYEILVVSSGAIALGKLKMGCSPKTLMEKQACAAVGQAALMQVYDNVFSKKGLQVAQILLNHDDFENRIRLKNFENTIDALTQNDIIPIINENDALAVAEIKVGDNDTLAALVASAVDASILILLSDIDGLYDKNPKENSDAKLIRVIDNVFELKVDTNGKRMSDLGVGGMETKIKAAKIVCSRGSKMIIINSNAIGNIIGAIKGEIGSLFLDVANLNKYKGWMLFNNKSKGSIVIDEGAKNAMLKRKSLLPAGIKSVCGSFLAASMVDITYKDIKIAKGIVNYSSADIKKVIGMKLDEASKILGSDKEIIHANDMVIVEAYDD